MTPQHTNLHRLDRQNYISWEFSFYKAFQNTAFRHLVGIGKTFMHFALII